MMSKLVDPSPPYAGSLVLGNREINYTKESIHIIIWLGSQSDSWYRHVAVYKPDNADS